LKQLKAQNGLTQQEVMSNLTYLVDRKWINREQVSKQQQTAHGTLVPSTTTWYCISSLGIEKLEGDSEYKPKEKFPGISLTATGQNVITLGDSNVVNVAFVDLYNELEKLKRAVAENPGMPAGEKLDVSADIESLKEQLAKQQPNSGIVKHLWGGIKSAVTVYHFIELVQAIDALVRPLLA
jgi:hypothetical protein